jgi:predicted RNA-binding Zn ribbon-like protein
VPVTRDERAIASVRLVGGRPCLDFVNTIHDRFASEPEDYLGTAERYLEWCVRARLLDEREAPRIAVRTHTLREVRRFRERLYAILIARIRGTSAPALGVTELDRWLHCAWGDLIVDPGSVQYLSWSSKAIDAELPLKRIALSALELLQEGSSPRLRQCAASDSCGWLFYDDTRNAGRRWCAMATCGTAAKMREYRAR